MIYRFGPFELDMAKVELRADGEVRPVEPQVFALLALLVENRERLVAKDEIIEKVWEGRPVSEAAVASRVKSARKALGDDGVSQRFIRTIHRQGFRFVADANVARAANADPRCETATVQPAGEINRPSTLSLASVVRASATVRRVLFAIAAADASKSGVSVNPGHTALTVTPAGISSTARERARPTTPCLAAQ